MIYIIGRQERRIDVRQRSTRAHDPAAGSRRSRAGAVRPGDDIHEAPREPADRVQGPDRGGPEAAGGSSDPGERQSPGGDGSSHQKRGPTGTGDAERPGEPRGTTAPGRRLPAVIVKEAAE